MRKPQLALYGNFGNHNIGNECTLRAALVHLRTQAPEIEVFCVCSDPAVVSREHGVRAVSISGQPEGRPDAPPRHRTLSGRLLRLLRRVFVGVPRELHELWRAYRLLKGVDALVLVGTGMLEDESGSVGWPLATYRWTLAARLRRSRVIVLGIGAGPFQTRATRMLSAAILRAAAYASYRDRESKDCVHSAGVDTSHHVVVPDLAFSLPVKRSVRPTERTSSRPAVALGVIDRTKFSSDAQYRAYLETLSELAGALVREGNAVRVIHGDGLYDHESVGTLGELLASKGLLNDNAKLSMPSIVSFDDLLLVLEDVDIVVASRYHNMILALMLGKPVVALSYHWKFQAVMSSFDLSRYVRPVRQFEVSWLLERSRELLASREALSRRIVEVAEAWRESVTAQYRVVLDVARDRAAG